MTEKEIFIQLALGSLTNRDKLWLAINSRTPEKILTRLSTDKNSHIRVRVAENPNTPVEVRKKLLKERRYKPVEG